MKSIKHQFKIHLVVGLLSAGAQAATQTFKMYPEPNAIVSEGCDVYTELQLNHNKDQTVTATLTNKLEGQCEVNVEPNQRTYNMLLAEEVCGTHHYTWYNKVDKAAVLVDNRKRFCNDKEEIWALIMIQEINTLGGTSSMLYSKDR